MRKIQKIGLVLILIGFSFSTVLFFISSGYNQRVGFWGSINQMKLVLKEGKLKSENIRILNQVEKFKAEGYSSSEIVEGLLKAESKYPDIVKQVKQLREEFYSDNKILNKLESSLSNEFEGHIIISYKYLLAFGIILIFIGLGIAILFKPKTI